MLERLFNVLEFLGVIVVLGLAFSFQLIYNELPCPLCLLQRVGFFLIAFGFLMNLRFGLRPSHYAMVILGALYTSFVALRQVSLHVVPGTGSYGDPVFGFHLYTWCFIISMIILVVTTIMMSFDRQYVKNTKSKNVSIITHALFMALFILVVVNIFGTLMECGIGQCPDNPTKYMH